MTWIKIKDYAAHRGVSDRMVRKYIAQGRIPASATKPKIPGGKQLLVDQGPADKFLSQNLKPKAGTDGTAKRKPKNSKSGSKKRATVQRAGIKTTESLTAAQKLNQEYAAALKKLDLETKQNLLVPAAEVKEIWVRHILAAKTKILGIKSKCAPLIFEIIPDAEDRETILSIIDSAAREALNDLADGGMA